MPPYPSSPPAARVHAFDWLRGLAVPLMIQCHALSLLWPHLRWSDTFRALSWVDGLVAPAFLLSAGFALAFVAPTAARGRMLQRIGGVLAAATLVNGMWFPLLREPQWILRVDILHCIGLSLLVAFLPATLLSTRPRLLEGLALVGALACFVAAPWCREVASGWARLANTRTGSLFPLLPWTGYVFVGVVLGAAWISGGREACRLRLAFLASVGAGAWALATWYPYAADLGRRVSLLAICLLLLIAAEHRWPQLGRRGAMRAVDVFGRHSLVAYVFHEALLFYPVAGICVSRFWGRRSDWPVFWALTTGLIAATYMASWTSERLARAKLTPAAILSLVGGARPLAVTVSK